MRDHIEKSIFWIFWSRGGIQVISWMSIVVLARLLDPSDFGLMALAGLWAGMLALLIDMGLGAAIIQFHNLDDRELNACFWVTLILALFGYASLFTFAPAIAAWFENQKLEMILKVLGLNLLVIAIMVVPDSLLRKRLELNKIAQSEILGSLGAFPVMIGIALAGGGVWALVAGSMVPLLIRCGMLTWFVKWCPGFKIGGDRLRTILTFSFSTLGSRISWAAYQQADTFIIGKLSGEVALGYYTMGKDLALLPVTKMAGIVNQLAVPVMAAQQNDSQAIVNSLKKVIRMMSCIVFPVCMGLSLVAEDLVVLALSEKWHSTIPILQVLCVYALFRSVGVLFPPVMLARFRANYLLAYNFALLIIMPLCLWGGVLWLGGVGAAVMWSLVYPIALVFLINETIKELDLKWKVIWEQMMPPFIATGMMVSVVLIIVWALPGSVDIERGIRLFLSVTLGALAFILWMVFRGGVVGHEIRDLISMIFGRLKQRSV